jgi:hypothetical protein
VVIITAAPPAAVIVSNRWAARLVALTTSPTACVGAGDVVLDVADVADVAEVTDAEAPDPQPLRPRPTRAAHTTNAR